MVGSVALLDEVENAVLDEVQQDVEAEAGGGAEDQGKHRERRQLHDQRDDRDHDVGDAVEDAEQRRRTLALDHRQADAEQQRKNDDGKHLAARRGGNGVARDHADERLDAEGPVRQPHRALRLAAIGVHQAGGHGRIEPGARPDHVHRHQPQHRGQRGQREERQQRQPADAADVGQAAQAGHAERHGGNDQRDDHHDQAVQPDPAKRLGACAMTHCRAGLLPAVMFMTTPAVVPSTRPMRIRV